MFETAHRDMGSCVKICTRTWACKSKSVQTLVL